MKTFSEKRWKDVVNIYSFSSATKEKDKLNYNLQKDMKINKNEEDINVKDVMANFKKLEVNELDIYTWEDITRVFWLGATLGLVASVPVILLVWWIV